MLGGKKLVRSEALTSGNTCALFFDRVYVLYKEYLCNSTILVFSPL